MTKQDVFNALFNQFMTINDQRDDLISASKTFDQGEQIMQAWRQANLNQLTAGNAILSADTPALQALVNETTAATASVAADLAQLTTIAADLNAFSALVGSIVSMVQLGTSVVAMLG